MKLFKKNERQIKANSMLNTFRKIGGETKNVGEFKKWKELYDGSRISVSINVYEIRYEGETMYLLEDTLGRVCAEIQKDKKEIMDWLNAHGYKTVHKFYIEDCGMTEETWKIWNSEEE